MNREYLRVGFEIKSVEENGIIEGFGSVFDENPDSYGDIVVKGAFEESIKNKPKGFKMLWNHNSNEPIGKWTYLKETNRGLEIKGKLTLEVQRAREVYALMKDEAIDGLSIGFDLKNGIVDYSKDRSNRYLKKLNLWEISPVTFPAKENALITDVKNIVESIGTGNPREIEKSLRDAGLSRKESVLIASLIKKKKEALVNKDIDVIEAIKIAKIKNEINALLH